MLFPYANVPVPPIHILPAGHSSPPLPPSIASFQHNHAQPRHSANVSSIPEIFHNKHSFLCRLLSLAERSAKACHAGDGEMCLRECFGELFSRSTLLAARFRTILLHCMPTICVLEQFWISMAF